jgi:hypothetical protein
MDRRDDLAFYLLHRCGTGAADRQADRHQVRLDLGQRTADGLDPVDDCLYVDLVAGEPWIRVTRPIPVADRSIRIGPARACKASAQEK